MPSRKNQGCCEPAEERKHAQGEHRQAAHQVAMMEVAEFVGEHRLDLVGVELVEQGVEEHDALGGAQPVK